MCVCVCVVSLSLSLSRLKIIPVVEKMDRPNQYLFSCLGHKAVCVAGSDFRESFFQPGSLTYVGCGGGSR